MSKKAVFLDRAQLEILRDLTYEEYDRVITGNTVYPDKEETVQDLREILDHLNEILED